MLKRNSNAHMLSIFILFFKAYCLFLKGLGLKWTDGAWSAVNTAERRKKQQDMQILLYEDLLVTDWHSCYLLLPLTVTLLDPQDRMSSSDRHQGCLLHMDRQGMAVVSCKERHRRILWSQHSHSAVRGKDKAWGQQGKTDTATVRSTFQGGSHFLVAGHPSSEDHCATSYTSALFLLRAFIILFDRVVIGHVNCNHIYSMKISENAPEWKDIHGHVPDCMLNMAHTTSGTSLLRDYDVTDPSYHFQWG